MRSMLVRGRCGGVFPRLVGCRKINRRSYTFLLTGGPGCNHRGRAGYFGNAVFRATPIAMCGELESNPLKFAVREIHEAIARMDDDYLRSVIDYLELQSDLDPNLGISSWARLPFYDADFGWGRPLYVGLGASPPDGSTYALPSPTNDGSLLYVIASPKEQMQVSEKLFHDI